jgi:hypothetical protein
MEKTGLSLGPSKKWFKNGHLSYRKIISRRTAIITAQTVLANTSYVTVLLIREAVWLIVR